jgi:hypothetical protein
VYLVSEINADAEIQLQKYRRRNTEMQKHSCRNTAAEIWLQKYSCRNTAAAVAAGTPTAVVV